MIEKWRKWRWDRYEHRVATGDDFAQFEALFSGVVTPDLAAKMPMSVLLEKRGQVTPEVRNTIDLEINRRLDARQPMIANTIAVLALIVSIIALFKSSS